MKKAPCGAFSFSRLAESESSIQLGFSRPSAGILRRTPYLPTKGKALVAEEQLKHGPSHDSVSIQAATTSKDSKRLPPLINRS
jgi:hypothetical protein